MNQELIYCPKFEGGLEYSVTNLSIVKLNYRIKLVGKEEFMILLNGRDVLNEGVKSSGDTIFSFFILDSPLPSGGGFVK